MTEDQFPPSDLSPCPLISSEKTRSGAHRSAGLAVMFAFGEVEALVAAFARLLLFLLFPGAFLENQINKSLTQA